MDEKITKIGDSYYMLIPVEWRRKNSISKDSKLYLRQTSDGSIVVRVREDDDGF
ncbi:AbrB/MazE/SpoVT family DNA-binding domain-containing protein [Acidiplasma sp.]|uniref:AbrB/MazE/SpoVT family DNA-binding domain-containing protein n=1 Tax=Acidiplasma sp. TaxID=1872114 RepID=UPI00258968FF|nr:AbrB/MazE/SpoVT family DNA-binding domain-containing protein [Acidiplasma sp.]